jgi:hypothetical protein
LRQLIARLGAVLLGAGLACAGLHIGSAQSEQLEIPPAPALELPCFYRPTALNEPWVSRAVECFERVYDDAALPHDSFRALAVAPDNTLYAASTSAGSILVFADTDGDALPDTPRTLIDGLRGPTALAYDATSAAPTLYLLDAMLDEATLYRWRDGVLTALVERIPMGDRLATGLLVSAHTGETRIYVALAACASCAAQDVPGAVRVFDVDGRALGVVASGLHAPSDLALDAAGALLIAETAGPDADHVLRLEPGFDACLPDGCAAVPHHALPAGSDPTGLAIYPPDGPIAGIAGVVLALAGTHNDLTLAGYAVGVMTDAGWLALLPGDADAERPADVRRSSDAINWQGVGLFPRRPHDVVVNAWGWVYISVSGGRIYAFRPQSDVVY